MIFLGNFNKISNTQWQVGFIHNMPLDPVEGIRDANGSLLAQDQLNQIGILVDNLPQEQPPQGQVTTGIFINPQTKEVTYTYGVPPKSLPDQLADLQSALIEAQNAINILLGV